MTSSKRSIALLRGPAEVVIIFDTRLAAEFAYRRKRAGHLFSKMRFLTAQLDAYFAGELRAFELELDPHGSALQQQVWEELRTIPYGATTTYGEIAAKLGEPRRAHHGELFAVELDRAGRWQIERAENLQQR